MTDVGCKSTSPKRKSSADSAHASFEHDELELAQRLGDKSADNKSDNEYGTDLKQPIYETQLSAKSKKFYQKWT